MPNPNLTLGIDARVTGTSELDRLEQALTRVGQTGDRVSKSNSGALATVHNIGDSAGKAAEGALALAGAYRVLTEASVRYAASGASAGGVTDGIVNGFRALRFAISPTLFTAASIGVGILVEETLRLVDARGKLIEQQSLLAATSGNSFSDIERIGSTSRISGANSADITAALSKLKENIDSEKSQSALRTIGVPSYASTSASPELLAEIAKGFSSIEDPVKRAQAAVDLFGADLAGKVLPQLNERFAASSKAVTDWGLTLSEADRNNVYVFKRDVQNLKDEVLSLGVGFQATWQRIGQSVAVEGAQIYANIRTLAGQISDFQKESGRKNGEVPYVSLLLQGSGTGDLDKIAKSSLNTGQSSADSSVQRDVAKSLRDEARSTLSRIDSSRDGVERQIALQRDLQSKAADTIRQNSAGGPLAGSLSPDQVRNASAQLVASTREETALKASLKIIEEQEKVAAKIEQHYISILEQAQQLHLNGEPFLNIGSGLLQTLVTSQDQADASNFRKVPSLLRNGEYNPNTAQDGTTDLERGPLAGGRFVSPSDDRREPGFNGIATGGLFDDPTYKQSEQIKLDGLKNELDYTSQIIQLRTGPGGELAAALQINELRLTAAEKEFETTNDIVALESTRTKLAYERSTLAEQDAARQKEAVRSIAGGLFDSLFGGANGISRFIESQLQSVGRTVVENAAGLGAKQIAGAIPKASDPKSTLGKLLQGTPFGVDPLKGATDLNTIATQENTAALAAARTAALSPSGGGGGIVPAVSASGGGGIFSGTSASNPYVFNAVGEDGLPIRGVGNAATLAPGIVNPQSGLGFNAKTVGAVTAAAGGGFAAFNDFKTGGAKNDVAGAGALLGSAAAITALIPGGQVVALGLGIASAATSLIAGLLPDPKKVREAAISKELTQNRYLAPTALNVTQDGSGNYEDFDSKGNLRQSPFRAVPQVNQPYTFYKGTTPYDVPGGVTSPYQPAPTVIQHIYQPGAIQTFDAGSFHDFAQKNANIVADAVATGLQNVHQRLTTEVQRAAR